MFSSTEMFGETIEHRKTYRDLDVDGARETHLSATDGENTGSAQTRAVLPDGAPMIKPLHMKCCMAQWSLTHAGATVYEGDSKRYEVRKLRM